MARESSGGSTVQPPGDGALTRWQTALDERVDPSGGAVVLAVTSAEPPAVSLLTSSSVRLSGRTVQVAVFTASSVARQPARTLTLLTTHRGAGLRLQGDIEDRRVAAHVTVLEGSVRAADVLEEAPWEMDFRFTTSTPRLTGPLLEYWNGLKQWLEADASGTPPAPPHR